MKKQTPLQKIIHLKLVVIICTLGTLYNCKKEYNKETLSRYTKNKLIEWNKKLTDVMITDVFSPPVASRIYAYPNIAAYEVMNAYNPTNASLSNTLNSLEKTPKPNANEKIDYPIAAIIAFSTVGKSLIYNREVLDNHEAEFIQEIQKIGINKKTLNNSIAYGKTVGYHILSWADTDGYKERSALSRYQIKLHEPGSWKPTPPDYMEAIEPNWNTIRTFVLDSANQFLPGNSTTFDTIPSSQFYKETKEVYDAVKNISKENLAKAKFWDCNPNISYTKGHMMYYKQQISPGGHWMMIACQIIKEKKLPPLQASQVLSKVSIAIADAFISCWSEKYSSSVIRPETYINKYIDPDWKPILQTPAFPEYTSGHSVASSAAATILSSIFGKTYKFTDSTEIPYGLPTRSFNSFKEASEEAAISRLYGGIHYMPSIVNGVKQGTQIGNYIVNALTK